MSRVIPPPIPVNMPRRAAITGVRPNSSAFCAPETAKSARPAASNTRTALRNRWMTGNQANVITPARTDTARYRQSPMAAGGIAPITTSRAMLPALAAAKDSTRMPNRSSRLVTPFAAPLTANTKVPTRSSTSISVCTMDFQTGASRNVGNLLLQQRRPRAMHLACAQREYGPQTLVGLDAYAQAVLQRPVVLVDREDGHVRHASRCQRAQLVGQTKHGRRVDR